MAHGRGAGGWPLSSETAQAFTGACARRLLLGIQRRRSCRCPIPRFCGTAVLHTQAPELFSTPKHPTSSPRGPSHLTTASQRRKQSSRRSISAAARCRLGALLSGARLMPPAANWKVRQASSCERQGGVVPNSYQHEVKHVKVARELNTSASRAATLPRSNKHPTQAVLSAGRGRRWRANEPAHTATPTRPPTTPGLGRAHPERWRVLRAAGRAPAGAPTPPSLPCHPGSCGVRGTHRS